MALIVAVTMTVLRVLVREAPVKGGLEERIGVGDASCDLLAISNCCLAQTYLSDVDSESGCSLDRL